MASPAYRPAGPSRGGLWALGSSAYRSVVQLLSPLSASQAPTSAAAQPAPAPAPAATAPLRAADSARDRASEASARRSPTPRKRLAAGNALAPLAPAATDARAPGSDEVAALLAAARAEGALAERLRTVDDRARAAEARVAELEAEAATLRAAAHSGDASAQRAAPGAVVPAASAAGGGLPLDALSKGHAIGARNTAEAKRLYLGLVAMACQKPRNLPFPDKANLARLGETEDAVGYALRLQVARAACVLAKGLTPRPSAADFIDSVTKKEYAGGVARILARDPVLRDVPDGAVKSAAIATRTVQIAIVGACWLEGVSVPRSASSTFMVTDTAGSTKRAGGTKAASPAAKAAGAKAKAITAALGVDENATLADAFVRVRERCGFPPALSADAAHMPLAASASSDAGDEEDAEVAGSGAGAGHMEADELDAEGAEGAKARDAAVERAAEAAFQKKKKGKKKTARR